MTRLVRVVLWHHHNRQHGLVGHGLVHETGLRLYGVFTVEGKAGTGDMLATWDTGFIIIIGVIMAEGLGLGVSYCEG